MAAHGQLIVSFPFFVRFTVCTITIHVNGNVEKIKMGCESDLKMWIEEVTEMSKTHSKLILQIYGCKAVPHDFDWQNCLKSQQKIDTNLSKICQNHQELWEWLKFVSCFTEIVDKSSSLRDSAKCWCCFKLSIWQLLSNVLFNNLFSGWTVWLVMNLCLDLVLSL